ncbi:MAG: pyruvate dehydrogenase (acetyl-transferring) E1 component subunit alpha [Candidatus Micrarchaeaceae archaeon]
MRKKVFEGSVEYVQVMDENGNIDYSEFPKEIKDEDILSMYKYMLFARQVDAKALSLQRQGRAMTYAPLVGEEATQVGSAYAMGAEDFFVPSFRQHAVFIMKGVPLHLIFLYWRGYEEANKFPENVQGLPIIVPVGSQMPHAVGVAFAQKYLKTNKAVVAYVGDGGTSEGDFSEALNFAGVLKVPLVTIIENNQWAISVPRSKQSAAVTLAQKAFAAGLECVQVDGNDVVGVYKVTKEAIEKAKKGSPQVIECITYRLSMHTTADDPTKYRSEDEVKYWEQRDPLIRVKKYLTSKGIWNENIEEEQKENNAKIIDEAVEKAESFKGDPKSMFTNLYSFLPASLKEEMDEAEKNNYWAV